MVPSSTEELYKYVKRTGFTKYSVWVFDTAPGGIVSLSEIRERDLGESGIEDGFLIFVSPELPIQQKLFVMLHEFGHHFRLPNKRESRKSDCPIFVRCKKQPEKIADKFALDFLKKYSSIQNVEQKFQQSNERIYRKFQDVQKRFGIL